MLGKQLDDILSFLAEQWKNSGWNEQRLKDAGFLDKTEIKRIINDFNTNDVDTLTPTQVENLTIKENITKDNINYFIALCLSTKISLKLKTSFIFAPKNLIYFPIVCLLNAEDIVEETIKEVIKNAEDYPIIHHLIIFTIDYKRPYILDKIAKNKLVELVGFLENKHYNGSILQLLIKHYPDRAKNLLKLLKKLANENPEVFKKYKYTPYRLAIEVGDLETLDFFIYTIEDNSDFLLFDLAIEHQQPLLLNYLIKKFPQKYEGLNNRYNDKLKDSLTGLEEYLSSPEESQNKTDERLNSLIKHIETLHYENKISKAELYLVAEATNQYIESEITSKQYHKLAKEVEGQASLGMKILGLVMITLGALILAAGLAITITSTASFLGAAAAPIGVGTMSLGAASIAAGIGVFAKKGCQHGLAKSLTALHDTIEENKKTDDSIFSL
ncbi:MAG: hypothetical protein LCH30_06935 [Proteobacteria bacterium]|nr:hypothetical protein [Pseudomonadota bacterium]